MIEQKAKKSKVRFIHINEWLTWKVVLVISLVLLVGFGLGLPYDYQVSDVMYNKISHTAKEVVGAINAYMVSGFTILAASMCWVFMLSCFTYKHDKIWIPILGSIFGWALMAGFGFYVYLCMFPFKEIYGEKAGMIHNIVLLVVIMVGSFIFTMCFFSEQLNKEMCKRIFTYLLEVAVFVLILLLLKQIWSRPTPINAFTPNKHFYKAWWEIRPFYCWKVSDVVDMWFWSSPAGFGCQSAIILFAVSSTLELTNRFEKHKLHTFFFFLGAGFCTILAILRLMSGENFLSDICLSLAIGIWASFGTKKLAVIARKRFYGHNK